MGFKFERDLLIAFMGNYLFNNVIAAVVALLPQSVNKTLFAIHGAGPLDQTTGKAGDFLVTIQYVLFLILAAVLIWLITRWYMSGQGQRDAKSGAAFGGFGFVVAITTALI